MAVLAAAAITAAAGGLAGLISAGQAARDKKEALEWQRGLAWQKYLIGKERSDKEFGIHRGKALSDLVIQERRLGDVLGHNISQFNTGLLGQAMGLHNAQIETSSGIGSSLAAEAASGVRGNAAGGLTRGYAQKNTDRQADLAERQNRDQLYGMIMGANQNWEDIGRERSSWGEGGYRLNLKYVSDDYNRKMALLGQEDLNRAIGGTRLSGLDYLTAFLSGANSGWSFGGGIAETIQRHRGGGGKADTFDRIGG
jgi:hypothetical protein